MLTLLRVIIGCKPIVSSEVRKYKQVNLSRYAMEAPSGRGSIAPTRSWPRRLIGVSGQRHAPAELYPPPPQERTPGTHWTGGWVGLEAGLDTKGWGKILCLCRGSNLFRPVCTQDTILTEPPQLSSPPYCWFQIFQSSFGSHVHCTDNKIHKFHVFVICSS
jgi:hypothetical protein